MPHVHLTQLASGTFRVTNGALVPKSCVVCKQERYGDSSPLCSVSVCDEGCVSYMQLTC